MNKAIVLSVLSVGAAILISPKVIGTNAHNKLQEFVADMNEEPGYSFTIKEENVAWFGSRNKLQLTLDLNKLAPKLDGDKRERMDGASFETLSFDIDIGLSFGPFLGENGIGLIAWDAQIQDMPENLTLLDDGVDYLYRMKGKASLSGDVSYTDAIPELEVNSAELGGRFYLSGWQGIATPVDGEIQYQGNFGSLNFTSSSTNILLENVSLDWLGEFDLATLTNRKYGKFKTEFAMQNCTMTNNHDFVVEMEEFSLYGDTKVEENEILDMAFGYGVKQLNTPFDRFENIQLAFALNNISGDFVRKYQSLLLEFAHPNDPAVIWSALEKPFIEALEAKPEFHVTRIGFEHSAGELISNASVKLSNYQVQAEDLADENFWLNNLLLNGSLSLPKSLYRELGKKILISRYKHDPGSMNKTGSELLEMAEQEIEPILQGMLQQGVLQEDGDLLRLNLEVAAGEANLNGNPIPLAALTAAN